MFWKAKDPVEECVNNLKSCIEDVDPLKAATVMEETLKMEPDCWELFHNQLRTLGWLCDRVVEQPLSDEAFALAMGWKIWRDREREVFERAGENCGDPERLQEAFATAKAQLFIENSAALVSSRPSKPVIC